MKKSILGLVCTFFIVNVYCQSADLNIIGSSGKTLTGDSISMSFTIGEAVIATQSANNYTLTQGFHQGHLIVVDVEEIITSELQVGVYPNPTAGKIQITSNKTDLFPVELSIFDSQGRLINTQLVQPNQVIDMEALANGNYHVRLNSAEKLIQTFTIIKNQ